MLVIFILKRFILIKILKTARETVFKIIKQY